MSADATDEIIKAARTVLTGNATVSGYVGARVYSDWSSVETFPLIRMSVPTIKDWEDDCGQGAEVDLRIHVYTRGGGIERHRIASAVRDALRDAALPLDTAVLRSIRWVQTLSPVDPDPTISSAVVRFEIITATA